MDSTSNRTKFRRAMIEYRWAKREGAPPSRLAEYQAYALYWLEQYNLARLQRMTYLCFIKEWANDISMHSTGPSADVCMQLEEVGIEELDCRHHLRSAEHWLILDL